MSRIPCNVNKDLLPLYVDEVCSEESKELVEEHLAECEACQNYYGAMKEGISREELEGDQESLISKEQERKAQASVIKGVKKQIANRHVRTVSIIVAVALLLVFVLEGLNGAFMWSPLQKLPPFDVRLSLDEMEVTELYKLENGYLYITVEMEEGRYLTWPFNMDSVVGDDGETGRYEGEIAITKHLFDPVGLRMKRCSFIFPVYGMVEDGNGNMIMAEDSAIRLTGKGDKSKVIWEEGQMVEGAPPAIESIAKRQMWKDDAAVEENLSSTETLMNVMNGKVYVIPWEEEK